MRWLSHLHATPLHVQAGAVQAQNRQLPPWRRGDQSNAHGHSHTPSLFLPRSQAAINTLLSHDCICNMYAYELVPIVGGRGLPDDRFAAHYRLYIIQVCGQYRSPVIQYCLTLQPVTPSDT